MNERGIRSDGSGSDLEPTAYSLQPGKAQNV